MPEPCLFCDNPAGSREHLWPKWIHDRHDFGPIHHQVGDREEMTLPNPQLTVKTVCGQCNNGWMSSLEAENIPIIGSMFQDLHIPLDRQQQESVSVWALKTAMILDSVQGRKAASRFYRSDECKNLRIHRAIPSRTLVVIARVSASLLIAKGYKFDRYPPGREWNVDGICRRSRRRTFCGSSGHPSA